MPELLAPISPGELCDKITILRIKSERMSDAGKLANVRSELAVLEASWTASGLGGALVDGEILTLNDSNQLIRAADITQAAGTAAAAPGSYVEMALWAERGRTDVQANAANKTTCVELGEYISDTRVYDATAGAGIAHMGQPLKCAVVSISDNGSTRKFSGLILHGGSADPDAVFGYVHKLPANNGGKLQFKRGTRNF